MKQISHQQRRARLAHRHHLLPHTRSDNITMLADDLLAFHSSDPATVFLTALVRMHNPSIAAIEAELYTHRRLRRHHAMRRTLWVSSNATATSMFAAAGRKVADTEHRKTIAMISAAGIPHPEQWFETAADRILEILAPGPLTTRDVGLALPDLAITLETQPGNPKTAVIKGHARVLASLGFRGTIVRARPSGQGHPWINSAYAWTLASTGQDSEHSLAETDQASTDQASSELAHRWLMSFGPATATDLQWWMGWTKTQTSKALRACEAEPVGLEGCSETGWLAAGDTPLTESREPWVAVLPSLDATTMGWKLRDWYLPPEASDAFDRFGNAGPTLWVDGQVVGAWTQLASGQLAHLYFRELATVRRRAVEQRLADVAAMIGAARFTERFPGRARATIRGLQPG